VIAAMRDSARLRYWLGPWASASELPERVSVRAVAGLPTGSRLYAPAEREPRGAFLISPGLAYQGPSDPRMDRLARIFATAGFVVLSPAVPDLMGLRLTANVPYEVNAALDALLDAPETPLGTRPAVFSVSVGSLAALRLAAMREGMISQLVVFGGYADPTALIRSLTLAPRDPLNSPAALVTLLDRIPGAPTGEDAELLRDAWRGMVRATWPRSELKVAGSTLHHPIARAIAADLPTQLRRLFLIGCGALPGAWAACEAALAAPGNPFGYLDPRPDLHRLSCPVTIVHGIADDVIPFAQAGELERALPAGIARPTLATGMFAHSNTVALTSVASRATAIARELVTFNRICSTLTRA
jgi:pimeloyl-ACP methyl ester carboxylesterase